MKIIQLEDGSDEPNKDTSVSYYRQCPLEILSTAESHQEINNDPKSNNNNNKKKNNLNNNDNYKSFDYNDLLFTQVVQNQFF